MKKYPPPSIMLQHVVAKSWVRHYTLYENWFESVERNLAKKKFKELHQQEKSCWLYSEIIKVPVLIEMENGTTITSNRNFET